MGVFKDLLAIKAFREDKAELVVRKQRTVLAEALSQRDAADAALAKYREWSVSHERSLYGALCQRVVKLRDIEDVQLEVVLLRQKEAQHEEQLKGAETNRAKQSDQLDADRKAHQAATRMKEKFVELARVFADEQVKELERKEDAELEEVAETRRDRADWEEVQEAEEQ